LTIWRDKQVLVTGATGMLGSWLVKRLLCEGAIVKVLIFESPTESELIRSGDIDRCQSIQGDLRSYPDVSRAINDGALDFVFHLGALTVVSEALDDPIRALETNAMGTAYLFEAIRNSTSNRPGVLVASSDKAYGSAKILPYTEETPLRGEGPYDVSKSCTDLVARSYFLTYNVPTVIARCGNIYGGGDLNWSRIVPGTIRDLLKGVQPVIRSNGKYLRDYIYVEDAVDAYLCMAAQMESDEVNGEAFNFSREEPLSVFEIYKEICISTVGVYVEPVVLGNAQHEITDQHLWSKKAREILGWESKYPVGEGLRLTVDWYKEFVFK